MLPISTLLAASTNSSGWIFVSVAKLVILFFHSDALPQRAGRDSWGVGSLPANMHVLKVHVGERDDCCAGDKMTANDV